jgi:cell wall-associated NlpC family hydrolase
MGALTDSPALAASHPDAPRPTRAMVVATARAYIGVPFRHQGRTSLGLDCAGLVIRVGVELGALPVGFDVPGYARHPDGVSMLAACRAHLEEISLEALDVGDVALFRILTDPQHLAIVGNYFAGGRSLIHAYAPSRKVTENRLDADWQTKLVGAFRIRGVV